MRSGFPPASRPKLRESITFLILGLIPSEIIVI